MMYEEPSFLQRILLYVEYVVDQVTDFVTNNINKSIAVVCLLGAIGLAGSAWYESTKQELGTYVVEYYSTPAEVPGSTYVGGNAVLVEAVSIRENKVSQLIAIKLRDSKTGYNNDVYIPSSAVKAVYKRIKL